MLYSEIRNKTILSINNAMLLGKIKGVYINKETKIPYSLGVESEDGYKSLKIKDIFCYNDIVTVLKDEMVGDLINPDEYVFIDIGSKVYDVKAFAIGTVDDLKLNPISLNACVICKDVFIRMHKVVCMQSDVILVNTQKKRLKKKTPLPKTVVVAKEIPEKEVIEAISDNKTVNVLESNQILANKAQNKKVISNYNFLLGRKILRDIVGINQELFAKKDTLITPKIISDAKASGKLVELSINSK